jgi:hypothetical protein
MEEFLDTCSFCNFLETKFQKYEDKMTLVWCRKNRKWVSIFTAKCIEFEKRGGANRVNQNHIEGQGQN